MNCLNENIVVTTDGASSGNPGPGGWAFLADGELHSGALECATNNQMELYAVLKALEFVKAYTNVTIVTDSKLVVGWLSQNWKCRNPITAEIVKACKITREAKGLNLTFMRVKGHANHADNNRVDRAAHGESQSMRLALA